MNISAPFIDRPVATTLLTLGVALAGAIAFRLLPVSPLPQVDYPTISVQASLPGASPETMAATVATPLERSLGRIAGHHRDDIVQFARLDAHHAAIRPEPRHRRRRARRAGGDQRRTQPAAFRIAQQSDLPQGQSRRRADHDPGAYLRDDDAGADVRRRVDDPRAEAVAGHRRRAGQRRRQLAAGRARRAQPRVAEQIRRRIRAGAQRRSPRRTRTGRRARSRTATVTGRSTPTTRRRPRRNTCP